MNARKREADMEDKTRQVQLAEQIVARVRHRILSSTEEDCDPWDEADNGVAWLDNEIGIASDCISGLPEWSQCQTVRELQDLLEGLTVKQLEFIYYVVRNGGSDTFYGISPQQIMNDWIQSRQ